MSNGQQSWEFHFRNCDTASQDQPAHANWFGAYHANCDLSGLSTPDMPARGCCWGVYLEEPNPKGGENSVYQPNPVVVDPTLLLIDIVGALKTAAYGLIYIATEGEDSEALNEACQSALNLSHEIVSEQLNGVDTSALLAQLQGNLNAAAAAVNMKPQDIISYAQFTLGLQPGTWGFMADAEYQNRIWQNEWVNNNGAG